MKYGLMIDLETVGLEGADVALAQIGSIIYNEDTFEPLAKFCQNVDWRLLVKSGKFRRDKSTMDWWRKQDKGVIRSVFQNPVDPTIVANEYLKWVKDNTNGRNFTLTSNHILFDIPKIDYFLDVTIGEKLTAQTRYNRIEDFATIRNKAKLLDHELLEDIESDFEDNGMHNALVDCSFQLYSLEACLGIMAGTATNDPNDFPIMDTSLR